MELRPGYLLAVEIPEPAPEPEMVTLDVRNREQIAAAAARIFSVFQEETARRPLRAKVVDTNLRSVEDPDAPRVGDVIAVGLGAYDVAIDDGTGDPDEALLIPEHAVMAILERGPDA